MLGPIPRGRTVPRDKIVSRPLDVDTDLPRCVSHPPDATKKGAAVMVFASTSES